MNYKKIHDRIIERAKNRTLPVDKYREKHHVLPRCLGGTDNIDNLVELTAREHYIIHQLLVKIYPNNKGLIWAAVKMTSHSKTNGRVNNRLYEWLKEKNSEMVSEQNKERLKCPEFREKFLRSASNGREAMWNDPVRAEQMRETIRKNNKKLWASGHGEKMNKAAKEYWSNSENREKASKRVSGKNNPSYGTHWYHNPETLDNLKCKPDEVPEGYVKGRKLKSNNYNTHSKHNNKTNKKLKTNTNTKCGMCGIDTGKKNAKLCDEHRYKIKLKTFDEDILKAIPKSTSLRDTCRNMGLSNNQTSGRMCKRIQGLKEKHDLKFINEK